MDYLSQINAGQLLCLAPLQKWRILSTQELLKEVGIKVNLPNFYKILRGLEAKDVLESYRDIFTKIKYVYLSHEGLKNFSVQDSPPAINKDVLYHDILVVEIARAMMVKGWIQDATLEHELVKRSQFNRQVLLIPDAVLTGEKNQRAFRIAFELELSRKAHQRVLVKADQYLTNTDYQYVMYFYQQKSMMDNHLKLFNETWSTDKMKLLHAKFMFFCAENLRGNLSAIGGSYGHFKNQKMTLAELFNGTTTRS